MPILITEETYMLVAPAFLAPERVPYASVEIIRSPARPIAVTATLIYLEGHVSELWKEVPKARTTDGKVALLLSIGELKAEVRRLEQAS